MYLLDSNMLIITNYHHNMEPFLSRFKQIFTDLNLYKGLKTCTRSIFVPSKVHCKILQPIEYCTGLKNDFFSVKKCIVLVYVDDAIQFYIPLDF
jgi:hypothetical protein